MANQQAWIEIRYHLARAEARLNAARDREHARQLAAAWQRQRVQLAMLERHHTLRERRLDRTAGLLAIGGGAIVAVLVAAALAWRLSGV